VRLWEWGHQESINELRKPGAFPKVTKVLFNAQGNKVRHGHVAVGLTFKPAVDWWGNDLITVCLSVCEQHNLKSYVWIFVKFGPEKSSLNLGLRLGLVCGYCTVSEVCAVVSAV